jgi:hypothetical protein
MGGAFCGLALYCAFLPGGLTDASQPVAGFALRLAHVQGQRAGDGRFHVHGQILNPSGKTCPEARLQVRFLDAKGRVLTTARIASAPILRHGAQAFDVGVFIDGAARFEIALLPLSGLAQN